MFGLSNQDNGKNKDNSYLKTKNKVNDNYTEEGHGDNGRDELINSSDNVEQGRNDGKDIKGVFLPQLGDKKNSRNSVVGGKREVDNEIDRNPKKKTVHQEKIVCEKDILENQITEDSIEKDCEVTNIFLQVWQSLLLVKSNLKQNRKEVKEKKEERKRIREEIKKIPESAINDIIDKIYWPLIIIMALIEGFLAFPIFDSLWEDIPYITYTMCVGFALILTLATHLVGSILGKLYASPLEIVLIATLLAGLVVIVYEASEIRGESVIKLIESSDKSLSAFYLFLGYCVVFIGIGITLSFKLHHPEKRRYAKWTKDLEIIDEEIEEDQAEIKGLEEEELDKVKYLVHLQAERNKIDLKIGSEIARVRLGAEYKNKEYISSLVENRDNKDKSNIHTEKLFDELNHSSQYLEKTKNINYSGNGYGDIRNMNVTISNPDEEEEKGQESSEKNITQGD